MPDPLLPGPLWLVGCGHIGSAMLDGWVRAGIDPGHVTVIRPSGRAVGHGVRVLTDYPEDEVPAIVLLAVKPYQLDRVAPALAPILDRETLFVSVLAGVELASLRARFPGPRTIVRAMPNLPTRIGKGMIGLFGDGADAAARAGISGLMASLGHALWFEEERLLDLVTALAGSGPAFVFRFIDALAEAGERLGFARACALDLAIRTVEGAAALAGASSDGPEALARQVTSPGGTTEAGLEVLDRDGALEALVSGALDAARRRSLALAEAARTGA